MKLEFEEKARRESEKRKTGRKTFSDKPSKLDLDEIQKIEYTGKAEEQLWEEYYEREEKFGTIVLRHSIRADGGTGNDFHIVDIRRYGESEQKYEHHRYDQHDEHSAGITKDVKSLKIMAMLF